MLCPLCSGASATFTQTVNGRTHRARRCAHADAAGRFGDRALMDAVAACSRCGTMTDDVVDGLCSRCRDW
jgi:tellurite resistance protein